MLFNTRYLGLALNQLRAEGYPIAEEDVARLSPLPRHHINVIGEYSFALPEPPGGVREPRDPDEDDEDDEAAYITR